MNETFGMMDPAYFVGKNELLKWLNDLLKLNVDKIESLGNGAVYCQILDVIYQGDIPMQKVNWNAKLPHEYVSNLKVLQAGFTKHKIQKIIDIGKLTRCKHQDNLEFIQWFKKFFNLNCGEGSKDYDAVERRKGQSTLSNTSTNEKKTAPVYKVLQQSPLMNKDTNVPASKTHTVKTTIPPSSIKKVQTIKAPSTINNSKQQQNLKRQSETAERPDQMREYEKIIKKVKTIIFEQDNSDQQKITSLQEMFPSQNQQQQQQQEKQQQQAQQLLVTETISNHNVISTETQPDQQVQKIQEVLQNNDNEQTINPDDIMEKENHPVSITAN